jgi:hypothetical protein
MARPRGRPRLVRAETIPLARVAAADRDKARSLPMYPRPTSRGDCQAREEGSLDDDEHAFMLRPCPYVGCRHHLYLDVSRSGSIKLNFPDIEPEDLHLMPETCTLDLADRGTLTLEETGQKMNLTRERVRQVEEKVLEALSECADLASERESRRATRPRR